MADYGHDLLFGAFLTPSAEQPHHAVALARLAEQAGFDLVTFQDHPYQPGFLDTWTLLSYVAAGTESIRLSPNVLNLPLRPPAVLARSAASLDLLSGGRVELGLGAGAFWDAIAAMGGRRLGPAQAVAALAEAIEIMRGIWHPAQRGILRVDGEFYQVNGARRGPAAAHDIGIWLGAYKPRMLALAGRAADGWLPSLGYIQPGELAAGNAVIDEAATAAGRQPGDVRRLLNISGEISTRSSGFLHGPAGQWAEELAGLALADGISAFILGSDDPAALERFAAEIAPAVRELVTAERTRRQTPGSPTPAGQAPTGTGQAATGTGQAPTGQAAAGTGQAATGQAGAGTGQAPTGTGQAATGQAGAGTGQAAAGTGQAATGQAGAGQGAAAAGGIRGSGQLRGQGTVAVPVDGAQAQAGAAARRGRVPPELGLTPTADTGERLSDVQPWDEATRPPGPGAPPGAVYTRRGRAVGAHLIEVHDHLRSELTRVRDLIAQVRVGALEAAAARSAINEMTMRQNDWTLGAYCASYCRIVTGHHTLEDEAIFPHLRSAEPGLAPVIDRLADEHKVIHQVLNDVDQALVALLRNPDDFSGIEQAVNVLTDTLLSHLAYEEAELLEPLARHGFYPGQL